MSDEPQEPDPVDEARQMLQREAQARSEAFVKDYQALCERHRCSLEPIVTLTQQGMRFTLQPSPQP